MLLFIVKFPLLNSRITHFRFENQGVIGLPAANVPSSFAPEFKRFCYEQNQLKHCSDYPGRNELIKKSNQ